MTTRLLLFALFVLLGTQTAQAEFSLCNRTSQPVHVAVAEDNGETEELLYVHGWAVIAAGRCAAVSGSYYYDHAFFAYQPSTGRVWDDEDGPFLCVDMRGKFSIRYREPGLDFDDVDEFSCPSGAVKRGFIVFVNEHENLTYDLK